MSEGERLAVAVFVGLVVLGAAWFDWRLAEAVLGTMLTLVVLNGRDDHGTPGGGLA